MTKKIDLNKSVYDLTEEYPELISILKEIGFLGVINPVVRKTLGKKTTLAKGCEMQGKDRTEVVITLEEHGFTVEMN